MIVSDKRPVAPISLDGIAPGTPATKPPTEMWVTPGELLVDASYQRDLTDRSLRLIRKIVEAWDWRRFKPPVVAMTDAGFECIDGQHTAIAAASHPAIDRILVVVVDATEQAARASAFIGHNRDRLAMTPTQLHNAAVVAGDADAVVIQQVTTAAGIRVLRSPPSRGAYKPGDTQAVAAVASLIRSRGESDARAVLELLAKAELAPVSVNDIRAADHLLHDDEFAGRFLPEALMKTIADMAVTADQEAKVFSATHGVPRWRGLAAVWFKNVKKVKTRIHTDEAVENERLSPAPEGQKAQVDSHPPHMGGDEAQGNQSKAKEKQSLGAVTAQDGNQSDLVAERASQPNPKTAAICQPARPKSGRAVPFRGEPEPGRSALDQRRAEEAAKAGGWR